MKSSEHQTSRGFQASAAKVCFTTALSPLCFSGLRRLKRMNKKMRVVQVPRVGGPFELVEREIPEPERGWVRVRVDACGVCHSDSLVKEGLWPGIQYPRVPGHEVIGVIDAVGEGVKPWKTGQRV